jgi:hypothetical protein
MAEAGTPPPLLIVVIRVVAWSPATAVLVSTPYDTDDELLAENAEEHQTMIDYITQRVRCGCREICVTETIDWDGEVDDDGILGCRNSGNSIDNIHCAECGAPYSTESFANLEFN